MNTSAGPEPDFCIETFHRAEIPYDADDIDDQDARAEAIAERDRQARHVSATADAVALVREIAAESESLGSVSGALFGASQEIVARLDGSAPDSIAKGAEGDR